MERFTCVAPLSNNSAELCLNERDAGLFQYNGDIPDLNARNWFTGNARVYMGKLGNVKAGGLPELVRRSHLMK
jgi:hypothetical protein